MKFFDNIMDAILTVGTVLLVIALGYIGFQLYADSRGPMFELQKGQWACTASHPFSYTTTMIAGKAVIVLPHETRICDTYQRIK